MLGSGPASPLPKRSPATHQTLTFVLEASLLLPQMGTFLPISWELSPGGGTDDLLASAQSLLLP